MWSKRLIELIIDAGVFVTASDDPSQHPSCQQLAQRQTECCSYGTFECWGRNIPWELGQYLATGVRPCISPDITLLPYYVAFTPFANLHATPGTHFTNDRWVQARNIACGWFFRERKHIGGLVPERCNSSALGLELRLSCTNPSTRSQFTIVPWQLRCHGVYKIAWLVDWNREIEIEPQLICRRFQLGAYSRLWYVPWMLW